MNIAYVISATSHKLSSSDVPKLRCLNDHGGDRKSINMKAVCTCERHETTSSDNCDMVNDRSGNESSTAVELLWTYCLSLSSVLIVNNRLSNQSRDSKQSRLACDKVFFLFQDVWWCHVSLE